MQIIKECDGGSLRDNEGDGTAVNGEDDVGETRGGEGRQQATRSSANKRGDGGAAR